MKTKTLRLSPVSKGMTFAGRYKILEELGRGGMGVVYKAQDLKLERPVALKFLAPELTQDKEAKERFIQEARAAFALDHPNICTIHEIDQAKGGQMYITMGFCEGQSLREKMERERLEVNEAVDIARQMAEGLAKAHSKGIVHRDIKPANIMITREGRVKIVDFGLAKLAGQVKLTRTGTTLGTVAYMSPEQAKGETVDHRTDIWSFGAILYEMLTGQTPFAKKRDEAARESVLPDMPALLHSILYDPVEPPSRLRKDLPRPVEQIILKALDKDRNRRHQTMDDLLKDLKAARSREMILPKPEKSIVVLPFEDMSPGKDNEYFSDGLTEEIITDLYHVHDLLVISRSSAMTFKGTKKTIPEIAKALNVRYVLEGSVRKAGNNLRITAQLIDSATDAHLWAEKYSGTLDDVFDIQEKVSRSIVEALKLKLTPEEKRKFAERPFENVGAYEYYLKAEAQIYKYTEESILRAIQYLKEAVEIAGENALLYAGQALAYFELALFAYEREDSLTKAEEYVSKALAMEPELPKAHAVMGWICMLAGDSHKIGYHLKKALALNPDETRALSGLVLFYVYFAGRTSEAATIMERLKMIDLFHFDSSYHPGLVHYFSGQYDHAREEWRKNYEMYPDNPIAQLWYSIALAWSGRREEAFSLVDKMARAHTNNIATKIGLLMKHGFQGNKEGLLNELIWPSPCGNMW